MALIKTQNFDQGGITNNGNVTTAITGATNVFPTTGTYTFVNSPTPPEGSWWVRCNCAAVNTVYREDFTASSTIYFSFSMALGTTDVITALMQASSDAQLVYAIRQNPDNTIQLRDGNSTLVTSTALTLGVAYQFVGKVQPQTASTGCYLKIYSPTGTLVWQSGNQSLVNIASATVDNVKFGSLSGTATTINYFDRIRVDNAAEPSIITSGSPPTANAGSDQTGIEPYSTVTLTGGSTGGAAPVTYSWAQLTGTTVTLNGSGANRTFTAPAVQAGATLTFRLTATGNDALSSTDDVSVTVLSHNHFVRSSGGWVPWDSKRRSSGAWV